VLASLLIAYRLEYIADYFYMSQHYDIYNVYLSIWAKLNLIQYGLLFTVVSLFIFIKEWISQDKKTLTLEKDKLHTELTFLK